MRGVHKIAEDPFEEAYISLHLQNAENGDYNSACWLRDNVNHALKEEHELDHYLVFFVQKMTKGGLRKNCREMAKKRRGERGAADFGEHNQLLVAREMWKYLNLVEGATNRQAQEYCNNLKYLSLIPLDTSSQARNSYYQFMNNTEKRSTLFIELKRDYFQSANSNSWHELCPDEQKLKIALQKLSEG